MGYRDEAAEAGARMLEQWADAGVKTVVTPCADCRHMFTRVYPKLEGAWEDMPQILHTVECVDRLIKDGRLELTTPVPMTVTYHDPCNLGRQGEPYEPWDGVEKKIYGQAVVYDPPRPRHNGAKGVYQRAARPARRHPRRGARRDGAQPRGRLVLRRRRRLPRGVPRVLGGDGGRARRGGGLHRRRGARHRLLALRAELHEAVAADAASGGPGADLEVHDVLELVALSAGVAKEAS